MREDMKKQISDTFINMLEKEDIDKITVTRLIEKCHISRQTFYYHFHDIMDVLEWTFQNATQELVKESLEADDRADALQTYLSFVRKNRKKLKTLNLRKYTARKQKKKSRPHQTPRKNITFWMIMTHLRIRTLAQRRNRLTHTYEYYSFFSG